MITATTLTIHTRAHLMATTDPITLSAACSLAPVRGFTDTDGAVVTMGMVTTDAAGITAEAITVGAAIMAGRVTAAAVTAMDIAIVRVTATAAAMQAATPTAATGIAAVAGAVPASMAAADSTVVQAEAFMVAAEVDSTAVVGADFTAAVTANPHPKL